MLSEKQVTKSKTSSPSSAFRDAYSDLVACILQNQQEGKDKKSIFFFHLGFYKVVMHSYSPAEVVKLIL